MQETEFGSAAPGTGSAQWSAEASRVGARRMRRRILVALAAMLGAGLVAAASASACTRPPRSIWQGSYKGSVQSGTDEIIVTVAQEETYPGSEELEFTGRATVTGKYEGVYPEDLTGLYKGTIKCYTGAEEFETELSGTIAGNPYTGIKVHYVGAISGSEGAGTYVSHFGPYTETGTWNTTLYAVSESKGSRPGEVELINPSATTTTSMSTEPAQPGLPPGTVAPVGSVSYEVADLSPGSTIDVSFKLPPGSHPIGAYKLVEGEYYPYPESKTKIEGETVTLELTDNGPWDENPAPGEITDPVVPVSSEVPEFGRCIKATEEKRGTKTVYHGKYKSAACTSRGATATGKYEWAPSILERGFTTGAAGKVTLETIGKAKVTCTGESGAGEIAGARTVANVTVRFSGCSSSGHACTTSGRAEGELETTTLEGSLGIDSVSVKAGKETRKAGLDLYPVGHAGTFIEYACDGGSPSTISGSLVAQVPADKMFTTGTVKWTQSSGHQEPEGFEGGPAEVLTNGFSQQVGLSATATETNEEPIEINAYY